MGADGGVCWVLLRQPYDKNDEEMWKLIPSNLLYWDDFHSENDHSVAPDHSICSTYGTSQEYDLTDLETILYELEDVSAEYKERTLSNILLDAYTKPELEKQWPGLMRFEEVLLDCYLGWYGKNSSDEQDYYLYTWDQIKDPNRLLDMKVVDWENKIRKGINVNTFGREETWT